MKKIKNYINKIKQLVERLKEFTNKAKDNFYNSHFYNNKYTQIFIKIFKILLFIRLIARIILFIVLFIIFLITGEFGISQFSKSRSGKHLSILDDSKKNNNGSDQDDSKKDDSKKDDSKKSTDAPSNPNARIMEKIYLTPDEVKERNKILNEDNRTLSGYRPAEDTYAFRQGRDTADLESLDRLRHTRNPGEIAQIAERRQAQAELAANDPTLDERQRSGVVMIHTAVERIAREHLRDFTNRTNMSEIARMHSRNLRTFGPIKAGEVTHEQLLRSRPGLALTPEELFNLYVREPRPFEPIEERESKVSETGRLAEDGKPNAKFIKSRNELLSTPLIPKNVECVSLEQLVENTKKADLKSGHNSSSSESSASSGSPIYSSSASDSTIVRLLRDNAFDPGNQPESSRMGEMRAQWRAAIEQRDKDFENEKKSSSLAGSKRSFDDMMGSPERSPTPENLTQEQRDERHARDLAEARRGKKPRNN